ncbi:MAG: short-chain dehydrogenase [Chloroflexi bacterium HGW-Chloroflexi-6]|nr:MAG: short-chain dehydrogenase [Chloroflexi bacterium HGW-Chloroflexi-6]
MPEKFPLALVTGGAHRLGRAFALALARQGYAIALHYHASAESAAATAAEIRALGVPAFPLQADLTSPAKIEALFQQIDNLLVESPLSVQRLTFNVLVNSAALMPRGDVQSLTSSEFDAAIALNLRAPLLCSQQAARRMGRGGLIVNISDIGASKAWTGFPAYTVSKAGLDSLTQVLARALAPAIRVNAIAPGLVIPSDDMPPAEWERLVGRLPLKRPAAPEEIASALEFLIKNEYITGQTIRIDGGYSLI